MNPTIGETLGDPKALEDFSTGLPDQLPGLATLMMRWAKEKEGFAKCSTSSILKCIDLAEKMGLRIGGILDSSTIEPCGDKALLIPTVRGIMEIACVNWQPMFGVVREKDSFSAGRPIQHHYKLADRGSIVAVYCDNEVMTDYQVREVQNMSLVKDGDSWTKHWTEMALRTVLRRRLKLVSLNFETARRLETFDEQEFGDLKSRSIPAMPAVPPAQSSVAPVQPQPAQSDIMKDDNPFPPSEQGGGSSVTRHRHQQTPADDYHPPRNNEDFSQHDDQVMQRPPADTVFDGPTPPPKDYVQPIRDDGKKITGILWGKVFQVYEKMHNGQKAEGKEAMNAVSNTIGAAVKKLLTKRDFGSTFKTNELLPMLTQEEVDYLAAKLGEEDKVRPVLQNFIDKQAAKSAPAPSF